MAWKRGVKSLCSSAACQSSRPIQLTEKPVQTAELVRPDMVANNRLGQLPLVAGPGEARTIDF